MSVYNVETKEGWLCAVQLASSLGWQHGEGGRATLNTEQLMRALRPKAIILNDRLGHRRYLRNAYGSAYLAAKMAARLKTKG